MKYQSTNTRQIIDHDWGNKKAKFTCPECSPARKNNKEKCLEYHPETNSAYCFHCNTTFFKYDPHRQEKQYTVPEWKNKTDLSEKAVRWFEGRMISQDTLNKFKVYTDTEWLPQLQKESEVVCFPFFRDGKLVNIKYRGQKKSFKLVSGAELVFYNFDTIKGAKNLIIVEGEIDCLSFYQSGRTNVVSVPNGANKNLEYLDSCIHLFDNIETVFLATDLDAKGLELRDELARRLGPERCKIVSFKNCKDANEYLLAYGGMALYDTLDNATEYPISGVVTIDSIQSDLMNLFVSGIQPGFKVGVSCIDEFCTWELGRLAIVTGIPGHGKSEFVDYLVTKLNLLYGWKAAYFTPENYPLKFHYAKIFEKIIGKPFSQYKATDIDYEMAFEHIKQNFFYIMNEEDVTVDSVLGSAKALVKSKGIKMLVLDPYNRFDHRYNDSETQYISRFLDKVTNFARFNNVLVILVAHPVKMTKNTENKYNIPTLYDIAGSANFYNKTDYGFTVYRKTGPDNIMVNEVGIYWQKIKFKHLGKQGVSELKYNYNNGRFEPQNSTIDTWDNSNWLVSGFTEEADQEPFETEPTEVPF